MNSYFKIVFILLLSNTINAQWIFNYYPLVPNCYANLDSYIFMGTSYNTTLQNRPILRSSNNGSSWENFSNGLPSPSTCYVLFVYGKSLFGVINAKLYKSTDYGETWLHADNGIADSYSACDITSYNDTLYLKTMDKIYFSINSGEVWSLFAQINGTKVAVNETAIYVGGPIVKGLFWSVDRGKSWKNESSFGLGYCQVISLTSTYKDVLIGCNNTNTGIPGGYKSETIKMNANGEYRNVLNTQSYGFLHYANYIFMVTLTQVYRSVDEGETWQPFNNGLPGYNSEEGPPEFVNSHNFKTICLGNDYFFVGGLYIKDTLSGGGIWRRSVSEMTGINSKEILMLSKEYQLKQNYPNPFNPTTTIEYSIPKASFVSIKVYDVLGREVLALVDEEKVMGNYLIRFNAEKLASGIYFCVLNTNEFTETKKMLLLR